MQYQSKIIVSQFYNLKNLLSVIELRETPYLIEEISSEDSSIGIKDLNTLAEKAYKKSAELKLFIIINSEKMTIEAQNSLLKILEEPGNNTMFLLHTNNPDRLLETIKSRCEIFEVKFDNDSEDTNIEYIFKDFVNKKYLEKIKSVEIFLKDYNNKESIKKAIILIMQQLEKNSEYKTAIKDIEKAYKSVDSNVSPKLIFDFICLSLEKI